MFNVKVIILILLSFVLGTCEYVVIGILPDIAQDLQVSITQTGLLISAFAVMYSIGAPLFTSYASRFPRYRTFLILTVLFILGNILCMLVPNYSSMIAVRVFLAAVSGTLISISMTFAPDIAPRRYTPAVLSWIFAGFNIASVVGVPFSMMIAQMTSWRAAFAFIAIVSAVLLLLMVKHLPDKNPPPVGNIVQQMVLLTDKRIILAILPMILSASATYCFYTYITPIFLTKMMLSDAQLNIAFILFGIATILSNLLSPMLSRLGGMRNLWVVFAAQSIFLLILTVTMTSIFFGGITIFILGLLMCLLNTPTQLYYLEISKKFYPGTLALAGSLSPSSYNVGIALGSFISSVSVENFGLGSVGLAGSFFAIAATLISWTLAVMIKNQYRDVIRRAKHIRQFS